MQKSKKMNLIVHIICTEQKERGVKPMGGYKGGAAAKFRKDVIKQKKIVEKQEENQSEKNVSKDSTQELPIADVIGIRKLPQVHIEKHPFLRSVMFAICFLIIVALIFLSAFAIITYISPDKGQEIIDMVHMFFEQCQFYWGQLTNK